MPTPLRVLIVEDSPDDAELMILQLTAEDFQSDWRRVQTESDYLAALDTAPDLILADWSLPQFSGLRALQLMRERGLDIPFVIVSGSIGEEAAIDALRQGAYDYVLKDRPARLGQAVHRALEDSQLRQERKQAEEALKKAAADWEVTFDTTTDGIYLLDSDHRIIRINRALERMMNISKEDAVGKLCWQVLHGSSQPIPACPLVRAKESKRRESLEYKAGERYFEFIVDPILDDSGVLTGAVHSLRDITERKEAEQKIAAMLRFQNEMLDTTAVWIDTLDVAGNITFWNRGAERVSGYMREEVMGHSRVWEWLYPNAAERERAFARAMAIIQQGERVDNFKTTIRCKDGQERVIAWYSNNLLDETGQIVGSIALGADVTWRKQAEARLHESEARYRRLTENARDIIFRFNIVPEMRLTYINPAVQEITGYTPEECYADPLLMLNIAHPDDAPTMTGFVDTLTLPDKPLLMRWIGKDGAVRWMESRLAQVYDAAGQIVAVEGITRDVTERKLTEEELHRAHEMLRTVLDTIPQRVAWRDRDAVYLGANEAFARDAGLAEPEAISGKRDADLIWQAYADRFEAEDRAVIATDTPIPPTDSLLVLPDGTRHWQRISKAPLHDATGAVIGVLDSYAEITDEKQADERLHQTLDELARSNAELERFAYVASHDLQEPLRMVASFVQLLGERYRGQLDADADDFIGFAVEGAQRMQNLINDLLAYSRVGTRSRPFVPTAMTEVLNEALWNLMLTIEESDAVITHDPLPEVLADSFQLVQLFQNLIGNALKFRGTEPPRVHISSRETFEVSETSKVSSKVWQFAVQDNGIGIEPQYHERIFGIFQRLNTRQEYAGTGIGLAVCKKVVERHGGRIWIESQLGQGTSVCFTLPALPETT